jgi:pimeloyl-ACP methyl ester carboxylesterase
MKKGPFVLAVIAGVMAMVACHAREQEVKTGTIHFKAPDGVGITADLYVVSESGAPLIILYHMADSSRGEYLEIAPKLNKLGFNCLAVDQRSGYEEKGVRNLTMDDAKNMGKGLSYAAAYVDVESALAYAKENLKPSAILLWGSSYSSDHVLVAAAQHPGDVAAVLSFSPGGYSSYGDLFLDDYVSRVTCPVFMTSAVSEAARSRNYFEKIPGDRKVFFLPKSGEGEHGSPALWSSCDAQAEYWAAVKSFLAPFAKQG